MTISEAGPVGIGTASPTTGKLVVSGGNVDVSSNKIINLAAPTASTDAATKGYVDAVAGGGDYSTIAIPNVTQVEIGSSSYTKVHEIKVNSVPPSSFTTYFELWRSGGGPANFVCARIYKNGVAVGVEYCTNSAGGAASYVRCTDTINGVASGDSIQLYAHGISGVSSAIVQNFVLFGPNPKYTITQ